MGRQSRCTADRVRDLRSYEAQFAIRFRTNKDDVMELAWLEDFLALSATGNFSKAAAIRNVTQPTFSRRIQNLELWMGVALVDRGTFPAGLTEEGKSFRRAAEEITQSLYRERDLCKGIARPRRALLSVAMLQTLAVSFYPDWLRDLEKHLGPLRTRSTCANLHDCVQTLVAESCDLMLCYTYPSGPLLLDGAQYPSIHVADEVLVPVSAANPDGRPLHDLEEDNGRPIAYLGYAAHAYLAGMVERVISAQMTPPILDLCYESAFAAALKAMAVAGEGMTWLPHSVVVNELATGQLVLAGSARWTLDVQIRAYRSTQTASAEVERVWRHLEKSVPKPCALTRQTREEIDHLSDGPPVQLRTAKLRGPTGLGKRPRRRSS
jgi:DNA-binding transcriptional LysR family regulator